MDAGARAPVSIGAQTPLLPPSHHARQAFHAWPKLKTELGPECSGQRETGNRLVGYPAKGIVAAKTGIAKVAIEMIADTASLIRRILRVRFPVQS